MIWFLLRKATSLFFFFFFFYFFSFFFFFPPPPPQEGSPPGLASFSHTGFYWLSPRRGRLPSHRRHRPLTPGTFFLSFILTTDFTCWSFLHPSFTAIYVQSTTLMNFTLLNGQCRPSCFFQERKSPSSFFPLRTNSIPIRFSTLAFQAMVRPHQSSLLIPSELKHVSLPMGLSYLCTPPPSSFFPWSPKKVLPLFPLLSKPALMAAAFRFSCVNRP